MRGLVFLAVLAAGLPAAFGAAATAGPGDVPPKRLSQVNAVYPYEMRLDGVTGEVEVEFTIDPFGNVVNAAARKSSNPGFESAAIESVLQWKFAPAIKAGRPVSTHAVVMIIFNLTDQEKGAAKTKLKIPPKAAASAPAGFKYDVAPQPGHISAPVYPFELLEKGAKGSASVTFTVDPKGLVRDVVVAKSTDPRFGAVTAAMVATWRFVPPKQGGEPCSAALSYTQDFNPSGSDGAVSESAKRLLALIKKTPEKILLDGAQLDRPLHARNTYSAVMPAAATNAGAGGTAELEVVIDRAGQVQIPKVISASTPEFGWAAATAVALWRFDPPQKNGEAVDIWLHLPFNVRPTK